MVKWFSHIFHYSSIFPGSKSPGFFISTNLKLRHQSGRRTLALPQLKICYYHSTKIPDLSVDKNSCTNGKRTLAIHQCSHAQQGKNKGRSFERPFLPYSVSILVFIQQIAMPVDTPNNQQYPSQLMLSNCSIPSADG